MKVMPTEGTLWRGSEKNSVRFDMYVRIEIGNTRLAAKVKDVTWLQSAMAATAMNHSCIEAVIA